ncbi:uncharacterized protein TRIADDRAFT_62748 [Trichoplax adhaerens]|uniref:Uncharacterized protein n=1 Tax=Trichoplax adhaerens TaxID=10228 RepID=B3SER4_TRIAD|nr:predicted protein [Trichoplax adhaerens]EDV18781.1 predicted protein [Trichoplax adhaerens]|eukprot:XP_002118733.1 predicted protein [Trichoplax adhaerens]
MAASLVMTWWWSSKTMRLTRNSARRYGNLPGRIHPFRQSTSAAVILVDSHERRVVGGDAVYIAMMMESLSQATRPSQSSTKHHHDDVESMSSLSRTSSIPETVLQYERQSAPRDTFLMYSCSTSPTIRLPMAAQCTRSWCVLVVSGRLRCSASI